MKRKRKKTKKRKMTVALRNKMQGAAMNKSA